jgi:hypothetical protein
MTYTTFPGKSRGLMYVIRVEGNKDEPGTDGGTLDSCPFCENAT